MDAYVPHWHEVKNPIAVETGLLHLYQITNIHFHFLFLWNRLPPRRCFNNNERLEMAVREWLRMQEPDLFRACISKPVPNCKIVHQYIEK
jgi:hypothetical protein